MTVSRGAMAVWQRRVETYCIQCALLDSAIIYTGMYENGEV